MRAVLIASQKGGVGKTTAAINLAVLAAGPQRVLLLDADPLASVPAALALAPRQDSATPFGDWSGWFYSDVVPGLDVFIPTSGDSATGRCERLAALLHHPDVTDRYALTIIDSPPLKGREEQTLVTCCDEVVLVTRAEPLALRTLPGILEVIAEERARRPEFSFHGLLLTLPPDLSASAPEVEFLRRTFGSHLLPVVLEHDREVEQALLVGSPVVQTNPQSPAAAAYALAAAQLDLIAEPRAEETAQAWPTIEFTAEQAAERIARLANVRPSTPNGDLANPLLAPAPAGKPLSRKKSRFGWRLWLAMGAVFWLLFGVVYGCLAG